MCNKNLRKAWANSSQLMELENILSLPVIDHDVNKFIGFIDVLDIAGKN